MYFSKSMAPLHTAVNFATLNYLFSHYYASYYAYNIISYDFAESIDKG